MTVERFFDGLLSLHPGDCLEVLRDIPENSVDAGITDPPYHLQSIQKRFAKVGRNDKTWSKSGPHQRTAAGFMNQKWDGGDIAFRPEIWAEMLRVLKPGAHLVAFGGTRTYHRMACAIEDAGFEIRDMISWAYGSGFPKSHDVSKSIDREAGATRVVVPKGAPVKRMIPGADQNKAGWEKTNGRAYQPGESLPATAEAAEWDGWGTALKPAIEPIALARKPLSENTVAANVLRWGTGALNIEACRIPGTVVSNPLVRNALAFESAGLVQGATGKEIISDGRWPANLAHDGSDEVLAAFPAEAGAFAPVRGTEPSNTVSGDIFNLRDRIGGVFHNDTGSAARFFYTAKADAHDRIGSRHPTVKPVDLMQWLCRLVTPKGGLVLDPFAGTGSTGEAAWREGFGAIMIERETAYLKDIRRRMALCLSGPGERARESSKAKHADSPVDHGPLFG